MFPNQNEQREQVGGEIDLDSECPGGNQGHISQIPKADWIGVFIHGAIRLLV